MVVAWFFFYAFGSVLVSLPDAFHERTFWQDADE
jgi:hypothetical protein